MSTPELTSESEPSPELATPTLSLKERQRQERERLILNVAAGLLAERGYHEMSLDDIAARVGIAKGTIYLHFDRKEDIVFALLQRGMAYFLASLDEILSSDATPAEKVLSVIDSLQGNLNDQRFRLFGALFQSPELHSHMGEWRAEMHQQWQGPQRRLAEVIEQGKASGAFDATLPTPLVVSLLLGMLSPFTYRRLIDEEGMTSEEITAGLRRFFIQGISGEPHARHASDTDAVRGRHRRPRPTHS